MGKEKESLKEILANTNQIMKYLKIQSGKRRESSKGDSKRKKSSKGLKPPKA